jgi:transcription elongation factor Elf1
MTDLKRTIKCSSCGNEASITLSSELEMKELLVAGKCTRCGSSLQISYSLVADSGSTTSSTSLSSSTSSSSSSSGDMVNLDESLFGVKPDIESDTLRDLMED